MFGANKKKINQELRMKGKAYLGYRRPPNQTNTFQLKNSQKTLDAGAIRKLFNEVIDQLRKVTKHPGRNILRNVANDILQRISSLVDRDEEVNLIASCNLSNVWKIEIII